MTPEETYSEDEMAAHWVLAFARVSDGLSSTDPKRVDALHDAFVRAIRAAKIEGKIEAMRECLEMADKAAHDVFDDSGYDDGSAAWAVHEKIRKRIKQLENQK